MSFFQIALAIALLLLIVAFFITMIRFIYGPSFIDRVVTFDLMTTNLIGVIAIYAIMTDETILIDIALVLALIGFFSIVALAYYIKYRRKDD